MRVNQPPLVAVPGSTASGIASGRELVELTTATGSLLDMTAAWCDLVILVPSEETPIVAPTLEEVADELDREIVRMRLAELMENPARLIEGDQLRERLAGIRP